MKKKNRYKDEEYGKISLYEINKALHSNKVTDSEKLVPKMYYDFLPLFQESIVNKLPSHQSYNSKIQLHEEFEPTFGALYSLSRPELVELKK